MRGGLKMRENPNKPVHVKDCKPETYKPLYKDHKAVYGDWCHKIQNGDHYYCTRPPGHKGLHESLNPVGGSKRVQSRWSEELSNYDEG